MSGLSDNTRGAVLMTVAMAAFVLNDTCMKLVTADLPLFQTIFLRGVLATAGIALVALRTGGLRLALVRADARLVGLRCAGEVLATGAFLIALRHMPLANLSAIMQSLPLFITLAAALFLGERVGWRRMSAILIGFAGVMLVIRPGTEGFDVWALVGLFSVLSVVLRDLSTRRLSHRAPTGAVAFLSSAAVALSAGAASAIEGWEVPAPGAAVLVVTAAGFLIVGYITVIMATRTGDVGVVAPFRYTTLVFAILAGAAVWGQFPDLLTLAGAAIIVASGIYTFQRERALARRAPPPPAPPGAA
ncbi:MAG: DMT family transporter [Rhodobacteraceae bacterium]|nr:DMT family transporter [Paracoccaceae bacterium]